MNAYQIIYKIIAILLSSGGCCGGCGRHDGTLGGVADIVMRRCVQRRR
jgi:hypothetical protein